MEIKADKSLLLTAIFLLGLGVVQVYSSSFIYAIETLGNGHHFFHRQLMFSLLGLFTMLFVYRLPHKHLVKLGWFLFLLAVVGIALTFVSSLGIKAGGATRWVRLPFGQRFEPAELLKYSLPFVAGLFVTKSFKKFGMKSWLFFLALITPIFVMLLKQPDFGSFAICLTIISVIAFSFGLKWRYIAGASVFAIPMFYSLVVNVPYRYARIKAFIDPWSDPSDKGFQIIQSMLSYYSGGFWGVGMGQGQGKLYFLPEAHTDFALSVLAEEMGFLGVFLVLILFGFIVFKGFQISIRCKDDYGKAIALGVTSAFALGVLINTGVTLGMLPTKGLSLPFISYGGSSLVSTCIGLGILMNIDRLNQKVERRESFSGFDI